jgi:hypothetical protein
MRQKPKAKHINQIRRPAGGLYVRCAHRPWPGQIARVPTRRADDPRSLRQIDH